MLLRSKWLFLFFFALLPFSLKADMSLWNRMLFSDKGYAKHIKVKVYILTDGQAADLLANPSKEPVQLLASELSKFPVKYLVARVRNLGNKHAWGTLACSVPCIWEPVKVPILCIYKDFTNYLICIEGFAVAESYENFIPKLTCEWDQLYTK